MCRGVWEAETRRSRQRLLRRADCRKSLAGGGSTLQVRHVQQAVAVNVELTSNHVEAEAGRSKRVWVCTGSSDGAASWHSARYGRLSLYVPSLRGFCVLCSPLVLALSSNALAIWHHQVDNM